MRVAVALVLGVVLGALLALGGLAVTDSWYEYRTDVGAGSASQQLLQDGWQIDRFFGPNNVIALFRRPRLMRAAADSPVDALLLGLAFAIGLALAGSIAAVLPTKPTKAGIGDPPSNHTDPGAT